eukprot:NODE_13748_length_429_cov_40.738411_g13725_i0.p2 GENE.NODE_13748_length_429_cov_40.738411_g13725_i0~~NODE_13748_length_429_cov_40.738411_g13725_i0.p2  ORF type:complete len:109 (+),score=16.74 NODE_13748_length_429_cov_40.738411_g13725_i0:52-378(+)
MAAADGRRVKSAGNWQDLLFLRNTYQVYPKSEARRTAFALILLGSTAALITGRCIFTAAQHGTQTATGVFGLEYKKMQLEVALHHRAALQRRFDEAMAEVKRLEKDIL